MGCLEAAEKQNDHSIANLGPIKGHFVCMRCRIGKRKENLPGAESRAILKGMFDGRAGEICAKV